MKNISEKNGENGEFVDGSTNNQNSPKSMKKNDETPSKRALQLKNWCFTWNNYEMERMESIILLFQKLCKNYVFQEETGENGTPHLQGVISLKKAMRWTELKLPKTIHWEKCRNLEASYAYCQKQETRTGNVYTYGFPEPEPELWCITELRSWQQSIIDIINEPVNRRTINWLVDPKGNIGKTELTRYLALKQGALICSGGENKDVCNLIYNVMYDSKGDLINSLRRKTTIILDIPRCKNGKVSYNAIEQMKNGLVTNTKYQCRTMIFNSPHVWVFSNNLPDTDQMSLDRWVIWEVIDDELVDRTLYYVN